MLCCPRIFRNVLLFAIVSFASVEANENCVIRNVVWNGEHSDADESTLLHAIGKSCELWSVFGNEVVRQYENEGFIAAKIYGEIDESGTLSVSIERGPGYVFAPAENLDSSSTRLDVFRKLSQIEEGARVSMIDLERAGRKLARIGYFEETSAPRMFRDRGRNRIVPAFSLRDANVSEAEGVLTYSSDDGVWEGKVDVNLYNMAGTARDLLLEGFTGEDSRHVNAKYKEPFILSTPWNVVLNASFDEETVEEDSSETVERLVSVDLGITRDIGFDFSLSVYLGFGEDDRHSSFGISYVSLDRFQLPRNGVRIDASAYWAFSLPDSLDDFLRVKASFASYYPVYGNFIVRYSASAGGIFPSDGCVRRMDLFALGGIDDFKAMRYHSIRAKSYGISEFSIGWQDGYDLSVEAFFGSGLYRRQSPLHGWARELEYGLAFVQYHKNWSVNLYYALQNGCNYMDGILGFGVKTLF